MKNWSLGYEIIRSYVRFAFWLTHKRVDVIGRNRIPQGKPIIFAPNHQNALMDPLALVCSNPHQTMWLARADIFKSETASSILKYLKLLPIYRIRDGKDNLSNNEQIFEQVTRILENKQTIALFPEAAHSGRRQMLPHKKAIPRIALEAEAKNDLRLDLQIVPVGIYYDHYWAFNRSLIIEYGEPISIDQYRDEYTRNPQKAMLSLRDEIHGQLSRLTLQIDSELHYQEYEDIRQLAGKAYSDKHTSGKCSNFQQLNAEKLLMNRLFLLESTQPIQFEKLLDSVSDYFDQLKKNKLADIQIKEAEKASRAMIPLHFFAFVFSLPVFVFGLIFNAIPFFIPRAVLRRKVKNATFLSTFNFVLGLIVFPFFYLIEAIVIFAVTHSVIASVVTLVCMPLAGKLAFNLLPFYRLFSRNIGLTFKNKKLINNMIALRKTAIKNVLGTIEQ